MGAPWADPPSRPTGKRLAFLVQKGGTDAPLRDERRRKRSPPDRRGARRARSARLVARWPVAGGRGPSGGRAAAVQDPGRRAGRPCRWWTSTRSIRSGLRADGSSSIRARTWARRLPVKAVNADGTPHALPSLVLTRGARRLAFLGGDDALVVLKGDISHKEFWVVDLETGRDTPADATSAASSRSATSTSSADGREIVFDRAREESDIVLFERPDR